MAGFTVDIGQAREGCIRAMKVGLVPFLRSSPGIGKSDMYASIAKRFKLKLVDIRLSQCDPTDLMGFPSICEKTNKASYTPMDTFPLATDEVPEGYNGWLILLDEFPHASPSVQRAAYKLVLDRKVGMFNLNEKAMVAAAGNLDSDNAMTEELSTAMQSRLVTMELRVDVDAWIDWAIDNGIDKRIISFIRFKNDALHTFKPDHVDHTFACPRTWEFCSRLIKDVPELGRSDMPILAGTISDPVSREFLSFTKIYKNLLTISQISTNPEGVSVPEEPSVLFALSGTIANATDENNISQLIKFVERMPAEFQVLCGKEILKRDPSIKSVPAMSDWIKRSAKLFF